MSEITIQELGMIDLCGESGKAWIQLDPDGTLQAYHDDGTTPREIFDGSSHRWQIPSLRGDAALSLMAQIAPMCQSILDSYSEHPLLAEYGHGRPTEQSLEICYQVAGLIADRSAQAYRDGEIVSELTPEEYLGGDEVDVRCDSTDTDLADLADHLVIEAETEGHVVDCEDMYEHLREVRQAICEGLTEPRSYR